MSGRNNSKTFHTKQLTQNVCQVVLWSSLAAMLPLSLCSHLPPTSATPKLLHSWHVPNYYYYYYADIDGVGSSIGSPGSCCIALQHWLCQWAGLPVERYTAGLLLQSLPLHFSWMWGLLPRTSFISCEVWEVSSWLVSCVSSAVIPAAHLTVVYGTFLPVGRTPRMMIHSSQCHATSAAVVWQLLRMCGCKFMIT